MEKKDPKVEDPIKTKQFTNYLTKTPNAQALLTRE